MQSLQTTDGASPPRLVRAVCLQMLVLTGVAIVCSIPGLRSPNPAPVAEPEPKKQERRIRGVPLPKPPAPQLEAALPQPAPARPVAQPPAAARPGAAPQPPPALARIAADSTAMHGVRMRVLVPRS